MKSVKNFFIERLQSIDHSANDQTTTTTATTPSPSSAAPASANKSQHKFIDGGGGGGGGGSGGTPSTTPSAASNSEAGDSSPECLNTVVVANSLISPVSISEDEKSKSPFDFGNSSTAAQKQKSRRKISLPWGRQSSISKHLGLSRQHTIDTPSSFRIFRQSSSNKASTKIGSHEATWVISDYIASPNSNELSVSKGQQVEIVEAPTANEPDFCLVRLNPQSDDAAVQEGLVPVSILKPPPGSQKTSSSRKDKTDAIQEQTNNRTKTDALTSSTKRRGLGGRKWLPQIGRKPTQSKVDKPPEKLFTKKSSEKNFKLPPKQSEDNSSSAAMGDTTSHQLASGVNVTSQLNTSQQDYEAEEEVGLELPPPMKPIQDPHLVGNGPPTFNKDMKDNAAALANAGKMDGLSEIEQIVKEKTEKHEETSKILSESNGRVGGGGGGGSSGGCNNTTSSGSNVGIVGGGDDGVGVCMGAGGDLNLSNYTMATAATTNNFSNNSGGGSHNTADNNAENNIENMHQQQQQQHTSATTITDTTTTSDIEAVQQQQKHRFPALAELISTEDLYIKDLGDIVNGYIAELRNISSDVPVPNDLKGPKGQIVFANIEAIYEWHRDYFIKALVQCQNTPTDLGCMIKRYSSKFQMYITYCNNKPKSEHIVTEHAQYFELVRQKLGHRLDLSDMLIKPVQRLTKYVLLLNTITKQIEHAGLTEDVPSMKEACNVMNNLCKDVNDIMVLRRLKNFDGSITAQGKLLLHGPLTCIENANRKSTDRKLQELHVFLFEQGIFFTERHNPKIQFASPTYIYRSHIQVNKMLMEELANNRFLLKSTDPNRQDIHMICYAATIDSHSEWLNTIRKQLQQQREIIDALTRPIAYHQQQHHHQNKLHCRDQ